MLAMAALDFQTDIDLIAHGKTPEALFASDVYAGGLLPGSANHPVIRMTNELIPIAQYIYKRTPSRQPTPEEFAQGIGLYIFLRTRLHEMLSTMSPPPLDVPWARR
jgi:hypothetical protein